MPDGRRGHGAELWLTTYDHLPFNRPYYERLGFRRVDAFGRDIAQHLAAQREALPDPAHRIAMRRPVQSSGAGPRP